MKQMLQFINSKSRTLGANHAIVVMRYHAIVVEQRNVSAETLQGLISILNNFVEKLKNRGLKLIYKFT